MSRILAAGSLALMSLIAPAGAEEQAESLTGEFYAMPADQEAGRPPMVFINMTGEAAKSIYEGLTSSAEDNECIGGKTKFLADSSGYCHFDEEAVEYFCSFSIDLQGARFAGGEIC
jgi:hypothetical protein